MCKLDLSYCSVSARGRNGRHEAGRVVCFRKSPNGQSNYYDGIVCRWKPLRSINSTTWEKLFQSSQTCHSSTSTHPWFSSTHRPSRWPTRDLEFSTTTRRRFLTYSQSCATRANQSSMKEVPKSVTWKLSTAQPLLLGKKNLLIPLPNQMNMRSNLMLNWHSRLVIDNPAC